MLDHPAPHLSGPDTDQLSPVSSFNALPPLWLPPLWLLLWLLLLLWCPVSFFSFLVVLRVALEWLEMVLETVRAVLLLLPLAPTFLEQDGQAPQPCEASTRSATAICCPRLAPCALPVPP
jgi:hypothetical protein